MTSENRRGQCPTLSQPMQTGDGLLVRLNPLNRRLRPSALAGVAAASRRYGNGRLEVTTRGNLQIRGLRPETFEAFGDSIDALGIESSEGVAIDVGPLAGLDISEIADPRPLAQAIQRGIAANDFVGRLGPKISVIIDGGGALSLDDLVADVRLVADKAGDWRVSIAGTAHSAHSIGVVTANAACAKVMELLASIAALGPGARARDLYPARDEAPERRQHRSAIGLFPLRDGFFARGFGLRFGQIEAETLIAFAEEADEFEAAIHLAPARALLAVGLTADACERLTEASRRRGLIVDANDPARYIAACQGSPGCGSARVATLSLAEEVARGAASMFDGSFELHLSGCGKGCAHPADAAMTLVGRDDIYSLVLNGSARTASLEYVAPTNLGPGFARLATTIASKRAMDQTSAACLALMQPASVAALLRGE